MNNFMSSEFTNMLPQERLQALSRDYIIRLCVVIIASITVLTAVSTALLLPTYVFLRGSVDAKEKHLASFETSFSSADEAMLSARLTSLSENADILSKLGDMRSVSVIVRGALAVPHPKISVSGIAYTPAEGKNKSILAVFGTADSREALRNYQIALQESSFASSAVLPVSSYAKDTDISFTITVTLAS
jgi:hypothetical protein